MNIQYPLAFKKALVKGLSLKKDETLFQIIYNNKCLSFKSLIAKLPAVQFEEEMKYKRELKRYLDKFIETKALVKGRAPDFPKYKSSGYSVNLEVAYKEKFPYTLMELDPLPVLDRDDYIFHLFLNKEPYLAYKMYPEEKHEKIDSLLSETIFYGEALFDNIPRLLASMNTDIQLKSIMDQRVMKNLETNILEAKRFLKTEKKEKWNNLKKHNYFLRDIIA